MNYYNYYTEIEDAFIRRRGKHLLLSPIDWAMIESWQERGIPLHIVLRGIEAVFDNFDKNPLPRTIKSLLFCREEIEAQFEEWTASRVGAGDEAAGDANPVYSREDIEGHIRRSISQLRGANTSPLTEDLERASLRLESLLAELTDDVEIIDKSLVDIEHFLDEALIAKSDPDRRKLFEKMAAADLKEYKSTMDKEMYDKTLRMMLLKRLREDLGIPRLGLFYL